MELPIYGPPRGSLTDAARLRDAQMPTFDAMGRVTSMQPRKDIRSQFQRDADATLAGEAASAAAWAHRNSVATGADGGPAASGLGRLYGYFADNDSTAAERAKRVAEVGQDWNANAAAARTFAENLYRGPTARSTEMMTNPLNPQPADLTRRAPTQPTVAAPAARMPDYLAVLESSALGGGAKRADPRDATRAAMRGLTLNQFNQLFGAQNSAFERAKTPSYKDIAGMNALDMIQEDYGIAVDAARKSGDTDAYGAARTNYMQRIQELLGQDMFQQMMLDMYMQNQTGG